MSLLERIGAWIVVFLVLIVAGCGGGHESAETQAAQTASPPDRLGTVPAPELGITLDNMPVVDSSTSAQPLAALLVGKVLGIRMKRVPWMDGSLRRLPVLLEPGQQRVTGEMKRVSQRLNQRLRTNGTHGAYVNLIRGLPRRPGAQPDREVPRADLILVARRPSEDEVRMARSEKVDLEVRPVALDAFVFIVNDRNPVRSLTLDQIRGIYTGRITNWKELGGNDAAIRPYVRNRNSGSRELMDKLVMKGLKTIEAPDMMAMSMIGPFNQINSNPHGIGYTVYFYEKEMAPATHPPRKQLPKRHARHRKVLAIGGVAPTSKSIADGRYPLVTSVFVVVRAKTPPDSPAVKMRDWLLTTEGQKLVAESGYVPLP
jgi:phosphate transport system substrate-binding protein